MFYSLRNRLFIIFTILLTVPFLVLSLLIPAWFTSVIEEQTKDSTVEMMEQYSIYINSVTSQAEDLGKQVLVNQATQEWLHAESDPAVQSAERLLIKNHLKMQLSSMMINNSNGMDISVFLNDGTGTWGDNPLLAETDWFKKFSKGEKRWVSHHRDPYQLHQLMRETEVNSYLIPLFDMQMLDLSGIIKVSFPSSLLETALGKIKLGENGRVYLLDEKGENVLSGRIETPAPVLNDSLGKIQRMKQFNGLIETAYNHDDYLVFFQKLKIGNWTLVSEITKSELFAEIDRLQQKLLIFSGVIFLLTILASYVLSSNIVRPLGKLTNAMKFVEKGDLEGARTFMPTIKSYNHEVGYAIKVFDHTIRKLNELIKTEYKANLRRKDAEYKALLLQINPHFLNNTLEVIGSLALQNKQKEVLDVSIYLGRMMRYSLNTKTDIVRLREEIAYIRDFIEIVKLRYDGAIIFRIDEDPAAASFPICKFIIQPLVENAVKYSLAEKTSADIQIRTEWRENQLTIVIEDDGIGMSEELISQLLAEEKEYETMGVLDSGGSSIGLRNVIGRLKLFYGSRFSIEILSEKGAGTSIALCIKGNEGDIHDEGHYSGR
ncbi:cache domain-containing sensor histidine kinase [Peribacillus frigoritolerans]|uniref:cache domain-containing sensor histidine kinase n=1 Tax=Peribacillus frigoritolerans TaxID=450367 RepID=UPI001059EA76|nr:sensor histidine kinase [Peribacillus frigoritolerans]TDL78510.1 HAMP domain-containing protein [Peribacillus frigoritolerans]